MQKFEITLKNDKIRFYDKFALFIFFLNGAGIIRALIYSAQTILQQGTGGISLLLLIAAITVYLTSPKKTKKEYFFLYASVGVILYWVLAGYWWIGLVVFILSVLYIISKKDLVVRTTAHDIQYPSFPKRNITWNEVNHIILKDGLLTIDLKNNRFIQQYVDESKQAVNEKEFNDFCNEQLNMSRRLTTPD